MRPFATGSLQLRHTSHADSGPTLSTLSTLDSCRAVAKATARSTRAAQPEIATAGASLPATSTPCAAKYVVHNVVNGSTLRVIGNGPYCNPYLVTSDDVHLITTAFGANRRVQIRGNVFIIDSSDDKPVRRIAARAFLGKSYPIALEPGHDPQHGLGTDKRAFPTICSNEGLYEMGLPHPFFRGPGGPSHVRQRRVSEAKIVAHLLRLHYKRFSQEASFIFFVHSVIQKRTVNGIKSSLEESKELATLMKAVVDSVGQADLTRAENAAALERCTDSMTQQMITVQGSQGYWRSKYTEVQAMVRSPVLRQPTLFMTLSAADWLWLDF